LNFIAVGFFFLIQLFQIAAQLDYITVAFFPIINEGEIFDDLVNGQGHYGLLPGIRQSKLDNCRWLHPKEAQNLPQPTNMKIRTNHEKKR
jgi:hypothetical protein